MTLEEILRRVTAAGGRLYPRGDDRLVMEAPRPLPENLPQAIKTHKYELLTLLRQRGAPQATTTDTMTPPAPPSVTTFITEYLTLAPDACVPGAALYAAFATWRCLVGVADGTCTWQELTAALEHQGARFDPWTAPGTWRGVTLARAVPQLPGREDPCHIGRFGTPCPQCGDTWQWPTVGGQWLCSWCFVQGRLTSRHGEAGDASAG